METAMKYELEVMTELLDMLHTVGFTLYCVIEYPEEYSLKELKILRTITDNLLLEIYNKISFWPEEYPEPSDAHMEISAALKIDGTRVIKLIHKTYQLYVPPLFSISEVPNKWCETAGMFELL